MTIDSEAEKRLCAIREAIDICDRLRRSTHSFPINVLIGNRARFGQLRSLINDLDAALAALHEDALGP